MGQDLEGANNVMLQELSKALVMHKQDFVAMLQENGVDADESMSKDELIQVFLDNTHNKQLLLGASLLINYHNKYHTFDGQKEISDDWVKIGYAVLNENFNGTNDVEDGDEEDEEFSYINPLVVKKLFKKGKKAIQGGLANRANRQDAQQIMRETALQQQKLLLEQQKMEQKRQEQKRKTTIALVVAGSVVLLTIVGVVIYLKRKK